ncbi:hypothetical protein QBC44DRAFT_309611 [Cladorrhinum sp. PSN332]|nr:hypothetical protein QBC44DRAFT_309611 [Cladorrhinum sp. PSN332]
MVSSTNPDDYQYNCVDVTFARLHNCATTDDFWSFPPLCGRPESRQSDVPFNELDAIQLLVDELGWEADYFLWYSDDSMSAAAKMALDLPNHPRGYFVGKKKTNFYVAFGLDQPSEGADCHAVVGTMTNLSSDLGPEGPFAWNFRCFQHSEGDEVFFEVACAGRISVIMLDLPDHWDLRERLERELERRDMDNGDKPLDGAWHDRH